MGAIRKAPAQCILLLVLLCACWSSPSLALPDVPSNTHAEKGSQVDVSEAQVSRSEHNGC